jgi:hypothetical protein
MKRNVVAATAYRGDAISVCIKTRVYSGVPNVNVKLVFISALFIIALFIIALGGQSYPSPQPNLRHRTGDLSFR